MTQGQRVIEIAANHPATAQFMCTKICARFFGENPPSAVVDAAVETWMANQDANDQIAQVVRTILLTNELRQARRPNSAVPSNRQLPTSALSTPG